MFRYLLEYSWLLPARAALSILFGGALLVFWGAIDWHLRLESIILSLFTLVTFSVFLTLSALLFVITALGLHQRASRFALLGYAALLIGTAVAAITYSRFNTGWMAALTAAQAASFALLDGLMADSLKHHARLFGLSCAGAVLALIWCFVLVFVSVSATPVVVAVVGSYSVVYGVYLLIFSRALRSEQQCVHSRVISAGA